MSKVITAANIEKAFSYKSYRDLVDEQLMQGETASGNNNNYALVEYTKLNVQRMKCLDKTVYLMPELIKELKNLQEKWFWVVLAEGWCGDVAQNLPVISKMADITENIDLKILQRDKNPAIMDAYLTNGGKAIPKLICLTADTMREKGTWGPRPEPAQKMVTDFKQSGDGDYKKFVEKVQLWYAKDKWQTIQKEFLHLVNYWKAKH
ncbi:MAG: thioredoxin family protein [Bacteroidetes bacterium]|nr:thioredoxin family protein [Bacteroidota bacterium]